MNSRVFSRPLRAAARLRGDSEEAVGTSFLGRRILIAIEPEFAGIRDAQETLFLAVNQTLRFCPNVEICVPPDAKALVDGCDFIARWIRGDGHRLVTAKMEDAPSFDAVVNIGTRVFAGLPAVTVNSSGWVARSASGDSAIERLHWETQPFNPLGALAASCMGVGAAFLELVGKPLIGAMEISLFTHEVGGPGTLVLGPSLPEAPLRLDAFLVGCGAVSNGWAYAIKRLPIGGRLQAIDCQSLSTENLGPYVAVGYDSVGKPKATLIRELLSPNIDVTDRPDHWEFFTIRLRSELAVPPLIIAGLDKVTPRHSVQRVWPETLIDIAAEGLESQVIVKNRSGDGLCVLHALAIPPDQIDWAQSLAAAHGLNPKLIATDPTGRITQAEINAAAGERKAQLRGALGKPRCGFINQRTLDREGDDPDFAPAVPFVTSFSGLVGAAETMKWLMGARHTHSLHFQRSFQSGRSRALQMSCDPECECQATGAA
jgi:hypothetical protein